jgi:hypothetical protein
VPKNVIRVIAPEPFRRDSDRPGAKRIPLRVDARSS